MTAAGPGVSGAGVGDPIGYVTGRLPDLLDRAQAAAGRYIDDA